MQLSQTARELLAARFQNRFSTDPAVLDANATDASGLRYAPEGVVTAQGAADVADLLRLAGQQGFAVSPRGAGTGLSGGALAVRGGVVLDLSAMNRILRIDPTDMVAEVEPGVITQTLRDKAAALGLYYPPDPAGLDKSTLGGNAATNAGGPACLKYGVTRDYVLGMTVALPTGELIRTGAATRKNVAGYDLTRLVTGSEGTLAVITGLTVKLIPMPESVRGLAVLLANPGQAMRLVNAVFGAGLFPCALEFMDGNCLGLIKDLLPFKLPGANATMLLIEFDGPAGQTAADIDKALALSRDLSALNTLSADTEADRAHLWWVRRQISLRVKDRSVVYFPEDIVVPLSRIASFVDSFPRYEERFSVDIFSFGHAGDGNIHVSVSALKADAADRAEACVRALLGEVLALGGTISGEHGIGVTKRPYLPMELSASNIKLQQGVKRLFDPAGILNPGKVLPD